MTSVEKRRSGRKSGGHRKHSDGGYSDTSSGGSFLDETDREVSSLTDRAFRSLCIGDEAVYNDSDLCSSSPCIQRDRQLAFSHSGHDGDRGDREREELKRAAHESFSLRMQQYGQDWIHGGMYGAEIQRDPQWEVYGERTQGRISATFQQSFVETSQKEKALREEQMSFFSNGATELSSQQRRSRSRVSSLIRAFNSEGQRDGAGMDGKLREWNDDTSWDKSALMSIQRELSEFSTSYHQNLNSGYFPSAGPFSSQDNNLYSSDVAAVAHMNSASSFMRSSHSKHSMSAQVNCNSNFFIHSEFSPFKVWRDHNRFPFQQGEVSGFMHCSEFPKWYETPMYKELSLEAQPQGPYRFEERGYRHSRNNLAPVVPPTLPRSTSTSTMRKKASAVEKRCESELTGHYPHRMQTQSLGTNRLPSQRPSTASPSSDMSRRVQDTISSVKALQQKLKMMTEQDIVTGMTANQQGVFCSNNNLIPYGNNAKTEAPNVVTSNTSTTPFNISHLLTPLVYANQEAETSEVRQYSASPQPVEHAPVRAESRGATPDVRMSSYKSRATSLLFNLKDNRKRVKSTYSPTKFKGLETPEKNKHPPVQEPRDTVIDIPDFPDLDFQFLQAEESNRTASHQYVNQYKNPGLSFTTQNFQPANTGQYSEYTSDYQTAQIQSEMAHHPGFTGFIPENCTSNQLADGQNFHEDLSSFTPYKQGMIDNAETLGGDAYRLSPSYTATETPQLYADNNQPREYLISKANAEQHFNETAGGEFTKVDRYQQLNDSKHDYSNVSSQDRWRQTNSQDPENLSLKAAVSPWKQEVTALVEKDQHAQAYQRAAMIEEINSQRDTYRGENQHCELEELEKIESRESFGVETFSHKTAAVVNPNMSNQLPQYAPFTKDMTENYGQQQLEAFDKYELQQYYGLSEENDMKDNNYLTHNYNIYSDQEYRNQQMYSDKDKSMITQETGQRKQYTPMPKGYEMQSLQQIQVKPQFEYNMQENPLSSLDNAAPTMGNQVKDRQSAEVKTEQAMAGHMTAQHAQAELAEAQYWAQMQQPKAELAELILAGQTGSETVKAEQAKAELTAHKRVNQAEHIKEEKRKDKQTEQSRQKQEHVKEEQTKVEQSKVQEGREEQRGHIIEEAGAEHLREEQGQQVKAKQADAEKLKAEHIKTELAESKQAAQARKEQVKTEQISRERITAQQTEEEQVSAKHVERERMESEQIRAQRVKAEQAEAEHRKAEQAKLKQIQEQQAKALQAEAERRKAEQAEAERKKVEQAEAERQKAEQAEVERRKAEQAEAERRKAEQAEVERRKAEQAEVERRKAEQAEAEHRKAKQAEVERRKAEQAEAERRKAEQAEAERRKAEQAEAERRKAEQAEAERKQAEQAEAERRKAEQAEAERIQAEQAEVELRKAEQAEAERRKAEQAEAERKQAEQAEAERRKVEQAEAERRKAEQAEAERRKAEQAEAERRKAEQAEAERRKAEQAEAERRKAEQAEAERKQAEQAEAERRKAEQAEAERRKAEQAEAERRKAEQAEAERKKAEQAEAERRKAEQAEQAEVERKQAEQAEAERRKAEQAEAERRKAEQAEAERKKAEQAEAECRKAEQAEAARRKAEQAEAERRKAEQAEAERKKAEQAEAERRKAEQAEAARRKAEQAEAERRKAEQAEAERKKAEQAEAERRKAEQAEADRRKAEQAEAERRKAEQAEAERRKAEQAEAEHRKAKQAETERRKAEQAKLEQIQKQQAKAEQEKANVAEVGKFKANHNQSENVKQERDQAGSVEAVQVNEKHLTRQISKLEERKAEQTRSEQTKVVLAKAELAKTEDMLEKAKPPVKLTMTQQVRSEPDKVERVKTELAKAKAELAKIKEKMRGEQKERVRNTALTKEDKTDVSIKVNATKNEEYKDQDQAMQISKQREDSVAVSSQSVDQANRGADDYERLREKYGFIGTTSPKRNKRSAAGNVSTNDANETPALSFDKVDITSNEIFGPASKLATVNTGNKEDVGSFKSDEVTESQYVYSESSKEFKLSGVTDLSTNVYKRANSDPVSSKGKDDSIEKLEKCDPLKHIAVSQQRVSELTKPPPLERKSKSTEHSVGPGKDHFTPHKALSHKERAQTKQEILTSKIKAHAEKEISAIKEKGFAVRDGFILKNSSKMLAGSQSSNIRQRPPSQEMTKKYESTMSTKITPKHHMEPSGIQMEPVNCVSPPSSAAIQAKPAPTTSHFEDHSQKQEHKQSMKSEDNVPKATKQRETKQTRSFTVSKDEMAENQKKDNQSGIKSPIQIKEQATKNMKDKQEENYGENSGKHIEGLKGNPAVNSDHLKKKKDDPSQARALVEAESSIQMMTEKVENKHEAVHEDSAPSLNLVFGQKETPIADDSLQIMGIMVTVQTRKPSVDNGQRNNSALEQINVKDRENGNSEPDKCHPSSGLELSKGNVSSKLENRDIENTHPTVKEDQTKVCMNDHPENMQQTSVLETTQKNVSENVTVKRTNRKQESCSINARPQRVTQPQEPVTEKGVSPTITVRAKNKVLAETKPLLYKQDIIASETKDGTNEVPKENSAKRIKKDEVKSNTEEKNPEKGPAAHTNENFMVKVVDTAINCTNNSNRADANHESQPSVKENVTTMINPSKTRDVDGKSAPPVEEKGCNVTPPKPFNKTSPSNHLSENENSQNISKTSPKHQYKETHIGENNQEDGEVHIGGIAIRVVPAVTEKDNMMGKHHVTTVPSDLAAANENKQIASSSCEEKVNTLNNLETSASSEKQMEDRLEDKLGVQDMLSTMRKLSNSLKISNQESSINATSENTQNGKSEKGNKREKSEDESKIPPMEGDYFQVQGVAEANNEPHNHTNVVDTSDAGSKGRERPGLLSNKAVIISNDSCNEGKHEVFVLDESIRKTLESSSVGVKDENMKRKNRETEDNRSSKPIDGPTERQSNKNEKTDDQAILIRKHHTENHSSISAREGQKDRNSHSTRETTIKEKAEVKPKPKERVSTIPEISAIADYARLKVIVSEDETNTIQEFPPNKKEGFFPLIQSRHSRRPVFAADPQDLTVKEKSLPTKIEVPAKVNKEPKPIVFPITEKEHQRTGMFKLGDKERQEKMILDAKSNKGVLDTGTKHAQHLQERNESLTTHLKNQRYGEQVADTERVHQEEQSILQPNNTSLQATTPFSAINRPTSTSVKPLDDFNPHEKLLGQMHNIKESTVTKIREERTEQLRQERIASQHEETKVKQSTAKQLEEEQVSGTEEEKRVEDIRVKRILEENRASLAEEERRATQREEERRAREREAIAFKIKERREKQREVERRAEEERAAQKEEELRAKHREEERKMRETEEKRRIKIEEEHRAKLSEEEERIKANEERRMVKQQEKERAAKEEQQRRAAQEEQERRAAQEKKQRRAAQDEQQKRAAQEEQQRRAAQEEQQRRVAQEEQQRRNAQEEKQRRAAQEEQQMRAAQEEQQRRAAQDEKQRRAAQEEKQRRAAQEEKQRRAVQEEQQRRAAQEKMERRATLIEEQRRAKQIEENILTEKKRRMQKEEEKAAQISEEERIKQIQEQKIKEQRHKKEEWMRTQRGEETRRAAAKEKTIVKQTEERQTRDERTRLLQESQAELKEEEKRVAQGHITAQREDDIRNKKREEEEKLANHREKEKATQLEEQKGEPQGIDALQYYAITSTESERKPRERQLSSSLPSQQRHNSSGLGSTEDTGSYTRPYRPHAPASPAPSLPRSNTSSPALGVKPSMFRVKDNTIRGSSFTKSVKPRFHKNFGEDFRVGSPMERGAERGEEEQEIMRRSAGTPVHLDTGLNRLAAIKESSTFQPAYSSQDYSTPFPQHRPYSRRSIVLDEDDSRSVISNMSEDVESFATSTADLADVRGLYDYERPESACSFSSDVSRSLGKPPTVPPKSEKALRRAQRLTSRRIKKELSKTAANSHAGVEKSLQEVPSASSSSTEVRSSSRQAVASPHFSSPVSLAHAPTLGSSLPSSHTEHQSSHSSIYASPHATGPISLAVASPHATAPVTLPVAPPNAASHSAAPKIVAHVPSSPTLHHANHPAPVTQYHVESSYPQSYPLTQRKVLQDLGSGQYFVVDVPVQVKTKTFFDPETGKYVQLNVRESGQSTSRPQPQQTYPQTQLQPQMQVKLQQQSQASPAGKSFVLYQGNHGYPQGYQPAITSHQMSSTPVTLHQDHQPVRESHSYGYPAPEMGQNSEGRRYSPEKTPYMDTVNDKDKTYNTVYNTHGPYESFPECDTNSQLAGSSICENDNSAHSGYQSRDIITMGELEDFMEVSDW